MTQSQQIPHSEVFIAMVVYDQVQQTTDVNKILGQTELQIVIRL